MWLALPAGADSLDSVELPVADSSQSALQDALREGLDTLIVRITGQSAIDGLPGVDEAREDPSRWVSSYHYESSDRLAARYDLGGLTRFLEVRGAPIWSMPRPASVIWLVDQGSGQGQLVTRDGPDFAALQGAARRRGLPLVYPSWDEQDQQSLALADIRGRFDDRIADASRRYQADLTVAAVLYPGSQVRARWRVLQGDHSLEQGQSRGADTDQAIAAMVDDISNALAKRYSVRTGSREDRSELRVQHVASLAAWQTLQNYLEDMTGMRQVQLYQVDGQQYTFRLDYAASDSQLRRQLDLLPQIRACQAPAAEPAQAPSAPADSNGASSQEQAPATAAQAAPPLSYCWQS
ncbi:hypothetical protein A11A3_05976 [Alcanivorax hongdengensis A-11-3]|uniref:DUF2066 domain-containing protein n=1 Tax=Alcanivorax hongdengensis A-11-3 TaxID=1177179 RepID=L0WDT2_9GAMM|nr:DUF2066 domain-containing protein [Alcanivorax hongdengensis]EKF74978.1 hypothetical protein A11A3_05976 [Alcanivorax hongdengensis A-11-3]